jgi:hypothetical protein
VISRTAVPTLVNSAADGVRIARGSVVGNDPGVGRVAVVFEAGMSREQAGRLATLMQEARSTRPQGVETAALLVDGERVRLVAFWKDRDTLDRYLAVAPLPRGTELMRQVGAEPEVTITEVLELG